MNARVSRPIRIGLFGAGVVGEGILRLLEDNAGAIERRMGSSIEVRRVVARDTGRPRSSRFDGLLSFRPEDVLDDPEIDVVVEVMGGLEPAGEYVRRAIEAGKSVVTANKALLAERGHELIPLSEARRVDLYFEAAVAGGIPVIRVLREALAADTVVALRGIVNGTSNYILSEMRERGLDFAEALAGAQAAGYAEADPTLDVGGGDATHKLAILATLAFGADVRPEEIATEGITEVGAVDIEMASRFGYVIKPLAVGAARPDGSLDLRVHPALVPEASVLASISGALNVVVLEGKMLGPCLLSGYGAGALPTAMSVVSDIVDVGRNLVFGASGRVPQRAWRGEHLARPPIAPPGQHECRWYLRFSVLDRPGVLARIAGVLGAFDVSIEQMVQEGRGGGSDEPVHVVMLTHEAREENVRHALREIELLKGMVARARALRIEAGA
ncbi:MAG: homoserine dehydrogenase [Sandaracinaceae bacterium]|nr:homoserine dehydrogenase [Sandaracinaceae bacterium]